MRAVKNCARSCRAGVGVPNHAVLDDLTFDPILLCGKGEGHRGGTFQSHGFCGLVGHCVGVMVECCILWAEGCVVCAE